ncbi:sugar-binding transcriptional regulator [Devosia sp. XJ19-1]|uniref:Sugar-binding transcriptional regulator n=1 Tax=Devosia ureilytica TaxID=2952754 RepID=A0A9Q4FS21_9HYPH|nr:sugar-binding transcriptional regulator [Devosia ureilytica]MCP8883197.1 sugar-binding transcriptional regulator [Devosia ureilytica]MCP8886435.1 sugar-binding transcriptional regulator [Devosia ureilytica]
MTDKKDDFEAIRQIYTVLMLHFMDGLTQQAIATQLNLSTSKVNRLITQGRKLGMVRIDIESPFQRLVDLEQRLMDGARLASAVVTPTVPGSAESTLQQVGRAAANQLLETLRDGDVIAITGGKAVSAIVDNLQPERSFDITVVPLTGGVQGKFYTDVNHLATQLADRLGGKAMLLHAPLFAESQEQRDMLMDMASTRGVFDLARQATVALVGIGSIRTPGSSYYDLHPISAADRDALFSQGVSGEMMAHLIHADGSVADCPLNSRLVALDPAELLRCQRVIGVAAGTEKVLPIQAALNGRFLKSLVADEVTVAAVLSAMESKQNVA